MACNNVCRLCDKLIISTAVNYDATTNELIIGLPAGTTYYNNNKYCIVVAQPIPTTTPISALVTVAIGTDPTRYPLVRRNCQQAIACNIRTRTKYSVCVSTNTVSGVFRLLGDIGCCGAEVLPSLPVVAGVAVTAGGGATPEVANVVQPLSVASVTPISRTAKTTKVKEVADNE